MSDTTPTSYGWATGPSLYGPRGIISRPEQSHSGNVILRVGNENQFPEHGWSQVAHVVLEPDEARALVADIREQLGEATQPPAPDPLELIELAEDLDKGILRPDAANIVRRAFAALTV